MPAADVKKPAHSILSDVTALQDFHAYRTEASKRPRTAQDKLSDYARLKVKVVKARNLTAADWSLLGAPTSDPYCEIIVNDEFQKKTPTKSGTINPVWNWEYELKIGRPGSVIQIQIFDEDLIGESDLLGYVEFPVAGLPFNQVISGWFTLFPPEHLQGEAPARLAKTSKETCEETCGAVYLKLMYSVVSGDTSDEFYAWCLPQPTFKAYPETGYVPTKMKALDAQLLIDQVMDIKEYAVDDLLFPLLSGFIYIFTWREVPLSMFALLTVIASSLRPTFFPAGMLFIASTFFVLLRSPERRQKMSSHPALVPLNDAGYSQMAALQDTDKMTEYLDRVIACMDGTVDDRHVLRRFAAFSSDEGRPATTLDDLKKQLRESPKKLDEPFVTFSDKPYAVGCLVLWGNRIGEVVSCSNPKEAPNFKYKVKFLLTAPGGNNDAGKEDAKKENGGKDTPRKKHDKDTPKFSEEEVRGEELELRLDFRWVGNTMVLALIPDVTETLIMEAAEPLEKIVPIVRQASKAITDLFQWQNQAITLGVVLGMYVLTGIFGFLGYLGIPPIVFALLGWLQVIVTVGGVTFVFIMNAQFFLSFVAQVQAYILMRQHKTKAVQEWRFFSKDAKAKDSMESDIDASAGGGFFGCAACSRKEVPITTKETSPRPSPRSSSKTSKFEK